MADVQPGGLYIVNGKTVDANGKATTPVEPEVEETGDGAEAEPPKKTLDDATVPQLKALAEKERIDLGKAMRKDDIIDVIVKARRAKDSLYDLDRDLGDDDPDPDKGTDTGAGAGDTGAGAGTPEGGTQTPATPPAGTPPEGGTPE